LETLEYIKHETMSHALFTPPANLPKVWQTSPNNGIRHAYADN